MQYDVGSSPAGQDLHLQVKFTTDACAVGEQTSVDFQAEGQQWCVDKFLTVVNNCTFLDIKPLSCDQCLSSSLLRSADACKLLIISSLRQVIPRILPGPSTGSMEACYTADVWSGQSATMSNECCDQCCRLYITRATWEVKTELGIGSVPSHNYHHT